MGLGLYMSAALPRKGWLKRTGQPNQILADISETAARLVQEYGDPVARWYWASQSESRLYLNLCPFDENVELAVESARVICSAKTSGAGPGYHGFVVELLDRLQHERGFAWSEGEDGGDETDYFRDRDEVALQNAMCAQVRAIAKLLLDRAAEGTVGFQLNLPLHFAPKRDAFACSPMGEWPKEWFEKLVAADDATALLQVRAFFPWWDTGLTAANLHKLGLAHCWTEVPWVRPVGPTETLACEIALACFERARELDPDIALPEWEMAELRRLLRQPDESAPPSEAGIGYKRTVMVLPLTGHWTVELPGYFHAEYDTDDEAQVYFFGDRSVRASTWSFTSKGSPEAALDSLSGARGARALDTPLDHLAGRYVTEPGAEGGFALSAWVAKADGLCLATISYPREADEPWVVQVASTIRAPQPTAE